MKEASLAENEKVITGGVHFFLGGDKEREEAEDSSDDDGVDMSKLRQKIGVNKKNKKNEKDLKRAAATMKKVCGSENTASSSADNEIEREEEERATSIKFLSVASPARPTRLRRKSFPKAFTKHEIQAQPRAKAFGVTARLTARGSTQIDYYQSVLLFYQVCSSS